LFHGDTSSFDVDIAAIRSGCEAAGSAVKQELLRTTSINRAKSS
jgi:hypothetical protein